MKRGDSIHERVCRYAHTDSEALYKDLHIPKDGYNQEQAAGQREQYGSNILIGRTADTVCYRLRKAFVNPFSLILTVLAGISFLTDFLLAANPGRSVTTVPIILCMLLLSGLIRFVQEMRVKRTADRLSKIIAATATVLRSGKWSPVSSSELVVGDQIRLAAGDRVPADIRLTAASNLFVSQSVISGESAILEKNSAALPQGKKRTCAGYANTVFMGSVVVGGTGEGVVLAVGRDTVYGGFSETGLKHKNGFDQGANSISWVLIKFMAILIPVVFIACGLTKGDWFAAFIFALSVAVGLTPEMLPMVINACLAKGILSMSQKQTIVKSSNAMYGFGSMDILCVDKTGTLTGDELTLEYYMDILGNESAAILDLAYLNSLYHTGVKNHLDAAILKYQKLPGRAAHFQELAAKHPKLDELPFDYERKIASVLIKSAGENQLLIKGGLEEVYRRCNYIEYKGQRSKITDGDFASVQAITDEMQEDGMKLLAVAYKPLRQENVSPADEQGFILAGYLAFFDAPKKTAAAAISKLQKLHIGIRVLTGDSKSVAVSICRRLGIDARQVLTGAELERLPESEQMLRIEKTAVFAGLSPKQKVQIIQTLQANGHIVGFLGDGMNDLPAITESDVGISVDTAVEAVKESADVLLLKKDLNVLAQGIIEGRKAFANMAKYIRVTASSNFGNIFAIVIASVCLPFFAMTSIQLLLLNLLYDTLCLVLPWDKVDQEALARPSQWSGRSLSRFMLFFGPISSVFDLITFGFLFFIFCPAVCGGSFASLESWQEQARFIALFQTGWFMESMWTQVLILHLLRTQKIPLLQSSPSLPVMTVTTLGICFFTILTFTPVGALIGFTPLPWEYFFFLLAIVFTYLLLVTLAKGWYVKKYRELL